MAPSLFDDGTLGVTSTVATILSRRSAGFTISPWSLCTVMAEENSVVAPSIEIVADILQNPVAGERDRNISRSLQSDGLSRCSPKSED